MQSLVVLSLGFQYLWDRSLLRPAARRSGKMRLIAKMGKIYSASVFTIITFAIPGPAIPPVMASGESEPSVALHSESSSPRRTRLGHAEPDRALVELLRAMQGVLEEVESGGPLNWFGKRPLRWA